MSLINLSVKHGRTLEEAAEPAGDSGPKGPQPVRGVDQAGIVPPVFRTIT